jgi:hypothetical protein
MKYPKYPVTASADHHTYLFFSEGPKGKITKGVIYSKIGINLFNLGFGDWNESLKELDDSSRSNNKDRDKVLATVAFTAIDFTNAFPEARIFIEGSTLARTRLYQIAISDNLLEINESFKIQGFFKEDWELFTKDRNYKAFLITRK